MRPFSPRRPSSFAGVTLLELLVSLAVLLIVLVTLVQFMTNVDQAWKSTASDPFAEAGNAFETVVNHLTTATLESYQDYADTTGAFRTATSAVFIPDHLARRSDLAFVCGASGGSSGLLTASGRVTTGDSVFFTAPQGYTQTDAHLGMQHLLNALGYFVEFSDEENAPAFIFPATHRWRWRLKEIVQPSESLHIYALPTSAAWVQQAVQARAPTAVLAENIVTLAVLCEPAANDTTSALATTFQYDSRNAASAVTRAQLPPRVRLALVAISEASAQILAAQNGSAPPPVVPSTLFVNAGSFDADLASLDATLTGRGLRHRIFQREILLPATAWTNTPSS
jgi:uncharacterized protein (TIGR02599 family)